MSDQLTDEEIKAALRDWFENEVHRDDIRRLLDDLATTRRERDRLRAEFDERIAELEAELARARDLLLAQLEHRGDGLRAAREWALEEATGVAEEFHRRENNLLTNTDGEAGSVEALHAYGRVRDAIRALAGEG